MNINEGLIFADGRMLTATEAAAYIKELKEENDKLKKEIESLKNHYDSELRSVYESCSGIRGWP